MTRTPQNTDPVSTRETSATTELETRGLDYFNHPGNWTPAPNHEYRARELWYPLANAVTQWEYEFHHLMLTDRLRMSKFQKAIERTVTWMVESGKHQEDDVIRVIDLGAGYGILSYWVVQSFHDACKRLNRHLKLRVYAIEGNPVTAGEAYRRLSAEGMAYSGPGFPLQSDLADILVCTTTSYEFSEYLSQHGDIIAVFDETVGQNANHASSGPGSEECSADQDIRLNADLIVSEIFGNIVDNEDAVAILANVISRHLAADGIVLPYKASSYLVPIGSPDFQTGGQANSIHDKISQPSAIKQISNRYRDLPDKHHPADFCYDCVIPIADELSTPGLVHTWIFSQKEHDTWRTTYERSLIFHVTQSGMLLGLKGYFRMTLTDPRMALGLDDIEIMLQKDGIEAGETSDCWKHLYLPIKGPALSVAEESVIEVVFRRKAGPFDDYVFYEWIINAHSPRYVNPLSQSYRTIHPFKPSRPTHLAAAINRLCTYVEEKLSGRLLLPDTDHLSSELIGAAIEQLTRNQKESEISMLPEFFLGWPSVEHEPSFLWFKITPREQLRPGTGGLFTLIAPADLPHYGVVYRYLVDNKTKEIDKVSLTGEVFGEFAVYEKLTEELKLAITPQKRDNLVRQNFLSVVVLHADSAFAANATQVQSMEAALYVLQSRLLIELLIREYRRQGEFLGRGEQARVLAHEVAQVSQLLGVGAPRSGRLVWDGKTMEAFLAGLPADEREQVKLGSVFCPLGHVYEAAVNYIDTISDAKTVQTPFDDYCDAPFFEVLQKLTEFGKKAVFAHWVRRQLRTIEGIDSLHEAMKLQSQFSEALSKTENFRIVDRLAGLDVRMPPSGLKCIQRSGGAPHEFGEGRRKIYVWIAKLVVAAFMSTLKFATNVDPGEDPLPVVVVASAKLDPPEVTILVANRLPDDEESIVASSSSQETGTRLVLKVLADNMERAAFKNVAVRFERATTEELENPDIGVLRRPGTKDDAFCTSISFQGIAAEVLLRQGRLIAD